MGTMKLTGKSGKEYTFERKNYTDKDFPKSAGVYCIVTRSPTSWKIIYIQKFIYLGRTENLNDRISKLQNSNNQHYSEECIESYNPNVIYIYQPSLSEDIEYIEKDILKNKSFLCNTQHQ